jgi:hypothetical protein
MGHLVFLLCGSKILIFGFRSVGVFNWQREAEAFFECDPELAKHVLVAESLQAT